MKESIYELEKELRDEKVKGEYYARQKENFISKTNLLEMTLLNAVDEVTAEIIIRKKKANEGKINNYPRKSHSIPDLKPGEVKLFLY